MAKFNRTTPPKRTPRFSDLFGAEAQAIQTEAQDALARLTKALDEGQAEAQRIQAGIDEVQAELEAIDAELG